MQHKPIRLFHLEDDDNDAFLVEHAVKRSGKACIIRRFHDPTEAIAVLEKIVAPETEAPHLIVTDYKMPKMTGVEFVCWLRQSSRFSCLPVIVFSASAVPGDVVSAYRCGANSFATKPVSVRQLNETIGHVLRYWSDVCEVGTRSEELAVYGCG